MPTTYRAAIIGTGRIASALEQDPLRPHPCTHAGHYDKHPRCEIVGGADIDPAALSAFGRRWSLPSSTLYSDYRRMLEEVRPDIVSVCAFAPDRLAMCRQAIEYGCRALWIEKALGCSLAEAEEIARLVEGHSIKAVVDHPRRLQSRYRTIKRFIDERRFGSLQSVTCHMTHQLIHTGTHAYDLLNDWCGDAVSVAGHLEEGIEENEPLQDQGGHAAIRFSSGTAAFVSAYRKKYYIFQFDLIFEQARILIGNDIQQVYLPDKSKLYSGFDELFLQDGFNLYLQPEGDMLEDLIAALDHDRPPVSSVANAVDALRLGLAIFWSHERGGRPVAPSDVPARLRVASL